MQLRLGGPFHAGVARDGVEATKLNPGSLHGNLYKKEKNQNPAGEAQSVLNSALTEETW